MSLSLSSCHDDNNDIPTVAACKKEYTVAVVAPLQGTYHERWTRTADWALTTIEQAQAGMDTIVSLRLEWYDENKENIEELARRLADRDDVVAIIGPESAENIDQMALQCMRKGRTLINPFSASDELLRRYAGQKFFWSLIETDVTSCEMMLYIAQSHDAKKVALLAPDDAYGRTFYDWFAFQAIEYGMEPVLAITYDPEDKADRDRSIQAVLDTDADYCLCTPSVVEDMKAILDIENEYYKLQKKCPNILFSDATLAAALPEENSYAYLVEGISHYIDPATGFAIAYKVRFGQDPLSEEARIYDAFLLSVLAILDCRNNDITPAGAAISDALCRVLTIESDNPTSVQMWEPLGLRYVISNKAGYQLYGASGDLLFDQKIFSNVVSSVYSYWWRSLDNMCLMGYYSSNGSHRVSSTTVGWQWKKNVEQEFSDSPTDITYPELHERWCLLIAAQEGWKDYRFQADILSIYQMLRQAGYDDEHIVLIMEDDLANNSQNPNPGVIAIDSSGNNLYYDVQVDYHISDISPADLENILCGNQSERLPQVIGADANDNVLVFWSGQGIYQRLCWLPDRPEWANEGLTTDALQDIVNRMGQESRFRKMLWMVEACHAGSVTAAVEDSQGVLAIAAATANETSKATNWDKSYAVYLSNSFTNNFRNILSADPQITFYELYRQLSKQTNVSHVQVSGASTFDNLYLSSISEFFGSTDSHE